MLEVRELRAASCMAVGNSDVVLSRILTADEAVFVAGGAM